MKKEDIRVGKRVFDRWWPWHAGVITKSTKTRTYVKWDYGDTWPYDNAHIQFLDPIVDTEEVPDV